MINLVLSVVFFCGVMLYICYSTLASATRKKKTLASARTDVSLLIGKTFPDTVLCHY